MTDVWLSCPKFTVRVTVDPASERYTITNTAPIVRKFIGQPLDNLVRWAKTFGDVQLERLP